MAEHLLFATLLGAVHLGTCDGSSCAAITSNMVAVRAVLAAAERDSDATGSAGPRSNPPGDDWQSGVFGFHGSTDSPVSISTSNEDDEYMRGRACTSDADVTKSNANGGDIHGSKAALSDFAGNSGEHQSVLRHYSLDLARTGAGTQSVGTQPPPGGTSEQPAKRSYTAQLTKTGSSAQIWASPRPSDALESFNRLLHGLLSKQLVTLCSLLLAICLSIRQGGQRRQHEIGQRWAHKS